MGPFEHFKINWAEPKRGSFWVAAGSPQCDRDTISLRCVSPKAAATPVAALLLLLVER